MLFINIELKVKLPNDYDSVLAHSYEQGCLDPSHLAFLMQYFRLILESGQIYEATGVNVSSKYHPE